MPQHQVKELEAQLMGRIIALESRLNALEAAQQFAGKHQKRIVTKRDAQGHLVADVYTEGEGTNERFNGP